MVASSRYIVNLAEGQPEQAWAAVGVGLRYVKGVGGAAGRKGAGEFGLLFDFRERTRLKREPVENLIACGAFDGFGLERRELLWQLGLVYRPDGRDAAGRQLALPLPTAQDMPRGAGFELRPMTDWDRMAADYSILGLSPNHHPM